MTAKPFFSGRISQALYDAISEHRQQTGESKTEVLIRALSAYVNAPLEEIAHENLSPSRLETLERRIDQIEEALTKLRLGQDSITEDNSQEPIEQMSLNYIEPLEVIDNKSDNPTDNKQPKSTVINKDNIADNTRGGIDQSNHIDVIEHDNKNDNEETKTNEPFARVKTIEVPSLPGLENEDPKKIKLKLNNTKNTKQQTTKIGCYLIKFAGTKETESGKKSELLWDVYKSDPVL